MIDIGKRLRQRLNDEARERNSEVAIKRSNSRGSGNRAWPHGRMVFGAACAAVVIGVLWLF